jgi:hypothetical protein
MVDVDDHSVPALIALDIEGPDALARMFARSIGSIGLSKREADITLACGSSSTPGPP